MKKFDQRHIFALGLILCVVGIGALFVGAPPQPARAQLSAVGTWIPSSGVGGTGNAVTLTVPNVRGMADLLGVPIRFFPANTNAAGGTTIAVNSFSAVNVQRASGGSLVPIAGGDFSTAVAVEIMWDGTQFEHKNPATGNAPVGSEIVLTGPTAPNGYLIENGTCVSETTYSALWSYYGSSDIWSPGSTGGACSSGQFHLKFANGRASVASNTQGSQTGPLTLCTAGVGNSCGTQSQALVSGNIPQVSTSYTPAGTLSGSQSTSSVVIANNEGSIVNVSGAGADWQSTLTINGSSFSFNGTPATITVGNASPSSFGIVNPNTQNIFAVKY